LSSAFQSSRSALRSWSKKAISRLVPSVTSPRCGCSWPSSSFSSVVLPSRWADQAELVAALDHRC
jgi:hypothetical protein